MSRPEGGVARIRSYDGTGLDATHERTVGATLATAVLVHGILSEKDEGGRYVRLARALADAGIASVRFSFRGHGESDGDPTGITIGAEMSDLLAAINVARVTDKPFFVVASSFGAVSTVALLASLGAPSVDRLVLWYPVLDLRDTFLEPHLPWGQANFGAAKISACGPDGVLLLEAGEPGESLPYVLFAEMRNYDIVHDFAALTIPTLVIFGTDDTLVSPEVARHACEMRADARFVGIEEAEHGFDGTEQLDFAIAQTVMSLIDEPRCGALEGPSSYFT